MPDDNNPFEPPVTHVGPVQKSGRARKFLLAVLASMVGSGLVLALLFALAMMPEVLREDGGPVRENRRVDSPPQLRILRHERVQGTDRLTVQGVVENRGSEAWAMVVIEVSVQLQGREVNACTAYLSEKMPARQLRAFQVECDETSASQLPEQTTYRISVKSALEMAD